MKAKDFIYKYANFNVTCAAYLGAPIPDAEPDKVNECNIPHELRFKQVNIDFNNSEIYVNWLSQEWSNDTDKLVNEIMRCYEYLAIRIDLEEDIQVTINITDRDGEHSRSYTKTILKVNE